MTITGWYGGGGLSRFTHGMNDWIACVILVLLGANMLRESKHPEDRAHDFDPTRGWSLVGLSVATSIDALAIGVSLSLIGMVVWRPALVIGLMALVMTFAGMRLGKTASLYLGQWAERIGGVALIGIGARIMIENFLK